MELAGGGLCFVALRRPEQAVPAQSAPGAAVSQTDLDLKLPAGQAHWTPSGTPQARLEGARIIVSGGRGMGGTEGFARLQELATVLGGAVGGSLPAVDAGWVPVPQQIGQSGRHVSPEIYVTVGISGTPQHLAGVATASRIFAINRDPDAAIFGVAELGIVGDWQEIVPALLQALRD